jgi:hypothetical protein
MLLSAKRRCRLQNARGSRPLEANDMKFSRAGEVAFIRTLHETSTSQLMTQEDRLATIARIVLRMKRE